MNAPEQSFQISRAFIHPKQAAPAIHATHATVAMLRHIKAFLASDYRRMHDPRHKWPPVDLNKEQAQRLLMHMIDVAVNRRAGIADHFPSEFSRGQADCNEILHIASRLRRDDSELPARWQHLEPPALRALKKCVERQNRHSNSDGAQQFLRELAARHAAYRPAPARLYRPGH